MSSEAAQGNGVTAIDATRPRLGEQGTSDLLDGVWERWALLPDRRLRRPADGADLLRPHGRACRWRCRARAGGLGHDRAIAMLPVPRDVHQT